MKEKKRVTQFMLDLYHFNAVTKEERKFIEKELSAGEETRLRYEKLKKNYAEIRSRYSLGAPPSFTVINNERINKGVSVNKKVIVGIGIAAAVICLGIPAFIYFNSKNNNNEIKIADDIKNEQIIIEDIDSREEAIVNAEEMRSFANKSEKFSGKQELSAEIKPDIKKETVIIAEAHGYETEVYTRGETVKPEQSGTVTPAVNISEQTNIQIPPGLTSVFDGMFANRGLTEIIIPQRITSIGRNAFANNPVTSVTIGANVALNDEAIPGNFASAYNMYGRAAGTYVRENENSNEWNKQ